MRKIYIFAALTSILLNGMTSCTEQIEKPEVTVPEIHLQDSQIPVFDAPGGTLSVEFSATAPWTAVTDQKWCMVSPVEGDAGVHILTVTSEANNSYDERNATLIIKSGTVEERLTIVQKQKDALIVTSDKIEVDKDGGIVTVEVRHNISFDYTISEDCSDWISPVQTKGMETTILNFEIAANSSSEKRQGKIFLTSGELSETVTVYQSENATLVITDEEYTVSSSGETIAIEIRSNVPYTMKMPSDAGWLSENKTRSVSTYTRYIDVAPNDSYDSRSAKIVFESKDFNISDTVTITQMQKDAIILANDEYLVFPDGGTLEFFVNTNVAFNVEIQDGCDWIVRQEQTRALEKVPLTFVISPNPEISGREAEISLTSGDISQTVKVKQFGAQETGSLSIVHHNAFFCVPELSGADFIYGTVLWGDSSGQEDYATDASHSYSGQGGHTVFIRHIGAENVIVRGIKGITEIDISEF